MTEDEGVLGNLPRSRPGRRSAKRDAGRPAEAAGSAAEKAEAKDSAAARPARASREKPARRTRPAEPAEPAASGNPVGELVGAATKLAGTSARVAGAVAHEVLRRLPRP